MSTDLKLCPDCGEPSLSAADGVLQCTNCGWSEEDSLDCEKCEKPLDAHAGIGLPCPIPQPTETDLGFPPCMTPPLGWICTRAAGHDGPCAALPVEPIAAAQIERFKKALHDANWRNVKIVRETAPLRHPDVGGSGA